MPTGRTPLSKPVKETMAKMDRARQTQQQEMAVLSAVGPSAMIDADRAAARAPAAAAAPAPAAAAEARARAAAERAAERAAEARARGLAPPGGKKSTYGLRTSPTFHLHFI